MIADDDTPAALELPRVTLHCYLDIQNPPHEPGKASYPAADNLPAIRKSQYADPQVQDNQDAEEKQPQGKDGNQFNQAHQDSTATLKNILTVHPLRFSFLKECANSLFHVMRTEKFVAIQVF